MSHRLLIESFVMLACVLCAAVGANAQAPLPYGPSINLDTAKKVVAPAVAEARKNGWNMAFAVVDTSGNLVYFEKMDDTQTGSINVAIGKARTAASFKRPSKVFEDAVKGGGSHVLSLEGVVAVEGGIPLVIDGKIVGAIGVSGATSAQDGQCAQAGVNSLK